MVGGESPYLDLDYYLDLVRSLKSALPDVTLKCFTASEVHHMTKLSGLTYAEVLKELFAAGVETLPGGGAEVFADRVRKIVAPGKEHPEIWLRCTARGREGRKTHRTMLYNHVETYEERVDHLLRLRDLQDETGGFMAFIPLPFHPENTVFERRGWTFTSGHDDLKMQAVSRLMLDNIEHIKAYWIMISTPLAQVALHFGANDIQGTVIEETIAHAAGAVTPTEEKVASLVRDDPRGRAHPRPARLVLQRRPPLRLMLRLGRVSFINTFPVEWALSRHLDAGEVEEVAAVPTELNRLLAARRARRRQRLEHRVRAQRRALRPPALALHRQRRRRRIGAARDAPAAAGGAHGGRHARLGDLRRARAGARARRGDPRRGRRGRRQAS